MSVSEFQWNMLLLTCAVDSCIPYLNSGLVSNSCLGKKYLHVCLFHYSSFSSRLLGILFETIWYMFKIRSQSGYGLILKCPYSTGSTVKVMQYIFLLVGPPLWTSWAGEDNISSCDCSSCWLQCS